MIDLEKEDREKWSAIGSLLWNRSERKIWLPVLFCACSIVYAVRAIMPLCVVDIGTEFSWNKTDTGTVLSSFFWGYALTQVAGGYLSDRFGAEMMMLAAMVGWSSLTVLTPVLTRSCCSWSRSAVLRVFILLRILTGCVQGIHFPALNSLLSRRVSTAERAFSLSFVTSGSHFGTLVTGALGSVLLAYFGWTSTFYFIGLLGLTLVVCVWYFFVGYHGKLDHATVIGLPSPLKSDASLKVPWLKLVSKKPFWAVMIAQFCGGWSFYILFSWLPTYFTETFPSANGSVSNAVPWLVSIPCQWFAGWLADRLIVNGYTTTFVRKFIQTLSFCGSGLFLLLMPSVGSDYGLALTLASASVGACSFHHSGVVCNVQDIAPRYTGSVFGLMNTAGAIPGFVGVYVAGYLLQTFQSWSSVFYSTSAVCFLGAGMFLLWASGDKIV